MWAGESSHAKFSSLHLPGARGISSAWESGHVTKEGVIGILHGGGSFELIEANHVAAISVGVHPKIKEDLKQRMERAKKITEQ